MVALLVNVLSWLKTAFSRTSHEILHPFNIPLPPVLHQIVDDTFISKYEEILVIGDVHGCFDELQDLMKVAEDNREKDKILKIFVGDLINKGPKNREVLNYVMKDSKSSCLSVRGNHDEVVLREYLNFKKDPESLPEKNKWIKELSEEEINYLISLPYTISIPSLNIIIVHAGIVPGLSLSSMSVPDLTNMRNVIISEDFENEIKACKNGGEPWAKLWKGPQFVYFGHDAKRKLQKCEYATGLDTGCVYGFDLTGVFAMGARKGTFISVKARQSYKKVDC